MASPVHEGEILAGKYRVERVLGQGGMGVVVAARHVELDELVALKFLLPEAVGAPEAIERFLREARASVRIKSEHVARVHDVGQLASGAPYIVMEYLEGSDLSGVLRDRGPLPVEEVVDYVAQACEALANAHTLGIVHRDLKPSNLMRVLRTDGSACIKVLDFGISKIMALGGPGSANNMTRSAAVLGSPFYMSPEQMMSTRDVDARTDIWALGVILYELLTAHVPFEADTLPGVSVLIATANPPPLRLVRPDVHAALEHVIGVCLAKNREQRFADVGALAEALRPFAPEQALVSIARAGRIVASAHGSPRGPLASVGAGDPRSHPTPKAISGALPATASSWEGSSAQPPSRRTAVAIVALTVTACLIGAFVVLRPDSKGATKAASAEGSTPSPPTAALSPAPSPSSVGVPSSAPAAALAAPTPLASLSERGLTSPVQAAAPDAGLAIEKPVGGPMPTVLPPARPRPAGTGAHPQGPHVPPSATTTEKRSAYDDM